MYHLASAIIPSPVGPLRIVGRPDCVMSIQFLPEDMSDDCVSSDFKPIVEALHRFFIGEDPSIACDLSHESPFEQAVLSALCDIPRGQTRSYADIATAIGRPGATQAVGNAVGRNPIPVLIPCHRVIRADGSLGGFRGPPDMKRRLLALEGVLIPEQAQFPLDI